MAQVRRAEASWSGDLTGGAGTVTAATSGIFRDQPTDWSNRAEAAGGKTSPEELLAAAHASCYSMAISNELSKAGHTPERISVTVEVAADKREAGFTVLSSAITVRGRVPSADAAAFQAGAEAAKTGCPISRALSDSVEVTLDAALED